MSQIKDYPWAKFRCEPASTGNILENTGLRRGNIPGSAAEILPFRDSILAHHLWPIVENLLFAGLGPTMAGEIAPHLWPIVDNQLEAEC